MQILHTASKKAVQKGKDTKHCLEISNSSPTKHLKVKSKQPAGWKNLYPWLWARYKVCFTRAGWCEGPQDQQDFYLDNKQNKIYGEAECCYLDDKLYHRKRCASGRHKPFFISAGGAEGCKVPACGSCNNIITTTQSLPSKRETVEALLGKKSLKPTQASPKGGRGGDQRELVSPGVPPWPDVWPLGSGSQTILPVRKGSATATCRSSSPTRKVQAGLAG